MADPLEIITTDSVCNEQVVSKYKKEEPGDDPNCMPCNTCNVLVNLSIEDPHDHTGIETYHHTVGVVDKQLSKKAKSALRSKRYREKQKLLRKSYEDKAKAAERSKNYRERQKLLCKLSSSDSEAPSQKEAKRAKTNADFCREYRQRQKIIQQSFQSEFGTEQPKRDTATDEVEDSKPFECVIIKVEIENEEQDDTLPCKEEECDDDAASDTLMQDIHLSQLEPLVELHCPPDSPDLTPKTIRDQPFICATCDKSYSVKRNLVKHMRVHEGNKLYSCDKCDRKFFHRENLYYHKLTHSGVKPFKCDQCSKSFILKSILKDHRFTHTGEKPYSCNICDKKFTQRSHLNSHKHTHTGDKPYTCNLCDKKFSYSRTLKEHIRIHSGEKPHKCHQCNKSFTQNSNLMRHFRTHEKKGLSLMS